MLISAVSGISVAQELKPISVLDSNQSFNSDRVQTTIPPIVTGSVYATNAIPGFQSDSPNRLRPISESNSRLARMIPVVEESTESTSAELPEDSLVTHTAHTQQGQYGSPQESSVPIFSSNSFNARSLQPFNSQIPNAPPTRSFLTASPRQDNTNGSAPNNQLQDLQKPGGVLEQIQPQINGNHPGNMPPGIVQGAPAPGTSAPVIDGNAQYFGHQNGHGGANGYYHTPEHQGSVYTPDPNSGNYFHDNGYHEGPGFGPSINCCGFISDSCAYLISEALYWQRDDGEIVGGNFFRIDDFDYELGGRFTYGRRWCEMEGLEFSYFGFDAFLANTIQRDPPGRLRGQLFGTTTGFNSDAFFSSFRNVQYLEQTQKTKLHSLEANRVWFGWDVAKFFYGVRYIKFDDDFRLISQNFANPPQFGQYEIDIDNNLFGLHIGGELFYDVGYRLSFSFKAKLGAYLNFVDGDTLFINNGTVNLANGDEDVTDSYTYELGINAHYQLMPRLRIVGGYELFGLEDVATTERNFDTIITPLAGTFYRDDDDAIFHGFNVGIEIYR